MRSTRMLAVIVPLFALAASTRGAAQANVAWSYTMNVTTDSGNGHPVSMAMRHNVTDRFLRTEMVQISGMQNQPISIEGMYTLFDNVDSTMTSVMPAQHMASVMGLGSMLDGAKSMHMSMHPNVKSTFEDVGPGERLSGHATHRYRVTATGTMDVSIMGRTCSRPMNMVSEMWVAPDVDLRPAMNAMLKHYAGITGQTDPLDQIPEATSNLPRGTALKTVTHATDRDAQGNIRDITTTMQYSGITHGPVSAELFVVPAEYKKLDMRKMMADMPAGLLDSARTAGGAAVGDAMVAAMCGRPK
jgi:hypothetical protein